MVVGAVRASEAELWLRGSTGSAAGAARRASSGLRGKLRQRLVCLKCGERELLGAPRERARVQSAIPVTSSRAGRVLVSVPV